MYFSTTNLLELLLYSTLIFVRNPGYSCGLEEAACTFEVSLYEATAAKYVPHPFRTNHIKLCYHNMSAYTTWVRIPSAAIARTNYVLNGLGIKFFGLTKQTPSSRS